MGSKAPSATPLLVVIDRSSKKSLFQQIFDTIRDSILSGRLRPGQQIPSTRLLAIELGVARSTVVLAYEQLVAEGYIEGTSGAGSFVSRRLPDLRPRRPAALPTAPRHRPGPRPVAHGTRAREAAVLGAPQVSRAPVPFRIGEPALDAFPTGIWTQLLRRRWRSNPHAFLRYGDPTGYRPLREAIAAYLAAARGVRADIEQVILVRGTQQAIDLAARVLIDPGDQVWVEDPGYLAARASFAAAGARLAPVPVDIDGLNVEAGRRLAPNARLVYVAPSHQFPLGVTLGLSRRLALLSWASETGAWVIEDDFDSEFRYGGRPLTALQGLDADNRVIYVGTFSKTLFPALRLGYMVVPPDLVQAFTIARALQDYLAPTAEQAVVADFLTGGYFARHIRRMRSLYHARQESLVEAARALEGLVRVEPMQTGMHLVGWLEAGVDDSVASRAALAAGVEAPPLSLYRHSVSLPPALLLGYAAVDERAIASAVLRLREALAHAQRSRAPLLAC